MYIVVDIGGTKTRVAASPDLEHLGEPAIFATAQKYEDELRQIVEHARQFAAGAPLKAIAAGVPARLCKDKRIIEFGRNIPAWADMHFADDLERELACVAHLCNDVSLCGLGEAHYGVAKGCDNLMYVTVSTGVNGIHIVGGTAESAPYLFSTGAQYISIAEPLITWEDMISGRMVEKRFGKHPADLGKDHPIWAELAPHVAFGLYNSIVHWTPDMVVLGGSMFNDIGIPVPLVQEHLAALIKEPRHIPKIARAQLGDIGGLWGGIARLKQLQHQQ